MTNWDKELEYAKKNLDAAVSDYNKRQELAKQDGNIDAADIKRTARVF